MKKTLSCYKLFEEAHLPEYGSDWAACFDLKASLREGDEITVYNQSNVKSKRKVVGGKVTIYHRDRVLVPTGLIFDLDETQSLRIHPRSGLSLKSGITVANCEGVVDADYVQQTYVMLFSNSFVPFDIEDGMRVAQGELVENVRVSIEVTDVEPVEKTNRTGGFGSTGIL